VSLGVLTVRPKAPAAPATSAGRLDFLDALRGVAVGLVLVQHVGELLVPAIHSFTRTGVQLGQLGVMLFFLCSGFIIPATLERRPDAGRRGALTSFWISRAFRLFPLFWVSLATAAVLVAVGRNAPDRPLGVWDWLANATMLPALVGSPYAMSLYWTLTLEMVFYLSVSGLFLLGLHRRSVALSLTGSGVCLVAAGVAEPLFGRSAPLALFCLATMFTGTVVHRWYTGTVRLRTLIGCVAVGLASGVVLLSSAIPGTGEPTAGNFTAMLGAWVGAYALFGLGLLLRHRRVWRPLRRLGRISYSIYLMQALVLGTVPATPYPLVTALVWVGLVLCVSEATYRLVEQPAIRLGRRLSARLVRPGRGAATPR
jgi:peptidoglycan/LPS O-acetylase OafA/YrhL